MMLERRNYLHAGVTELECSSFLLDKFSAKRISVGACKSHRTNHIFTPTEAVTVLFHEARAFYSRALL